MVKQLLVMGLSALALAACEPDDETSPPTSPVIPQVQAEEAETTASWVPPSCAPDHTQENSWIGHGQLADNHPLVQRYGHVCKAIYPLGGFQWKRATAAYLCRIQVDYEGENGGVSENKLVAALGEDALKSRLLRRRMMALTELAVVFLETASGYEMVTQIEGLKAQISQIDDAEGAVALAYLAGSLGTGYQADALCSAEIAASGSIWRINHADVFINCAPREWRDLQVDSVALSITSKSRPQTNPDGSVTAMCVD